MKNNNTDKKLTILWGSTSKLVAENKHIQEKLLDIKAKGVEGVDDIKALGFELGTLIREHAEALDGAVSVYAAEKYIAMNGN